MTRSADPAPPLDPARRLCDIARIAELAELSRREGYRPGQVGGRLFSAADVLLVLDELAALRARLTQTEDADATIAALNEKVDALEWEIESGEPANRRKLLATVLARVTELEQQLTQTAQERDAFLAVRDAQPVYYAEALDLIADELRTLAPADFDARRWKILAVLTNAAHVRRRIQAELTQTAQARDHLQQFVELLDGQTEPLHPLAWQIALAAAKRWLARSPAPTPATVDDGHVE